MLYGTASAPAIYNCIGVYPKPEIPRHVHASYFGFIDLPMSSDNGDKVGMTRSMAFTPTPPVPHVRGGARVHNSARDAVCGDSRVTTLTWVTF